MEIEYILYIYVYNGNFNIPVMGIEYNGNFDIPMMGIEYIQWVFQYTHDGNRINTMGFSIYPRWE